MRPDVCVVPFVFVNYVLMQIYIFYRLYPSYDMAKIGSYAADPVLVHCQMYVYIG